jgi:hypothetical protein
MLCPPIDEGRGLCECKSSQKVVKNIRMALCVYKFNQLPDGLEGGKCVGGGSESVDSM